MGENFNLINRLRLTHSQMVVWLFWLDCRICWLDDGCMSISLRYSYQINCFVKARWSTELSVQWMCWFSGEHSDSWVVNILLRFGLLTTVSILKHTCKYSQFSKHKSEKWKQLNNNNNNNNNNNKGLLAFLVKNGSSMLS